MKILTVFGTRPEAIKLAPVIKELERRHGVISRVCVTAQHRVMLDQALATFQIKPDYDLDIMREDQSLSDVTMCAIAGLKSVLKKSKPNLVLVQGDTTTAFAASLAAFYLKIPIGHVEAGLRTGDKYNPFPEEMNRGLVDSLSDFCFAPTVNAKRNLLREGISSERILVTGNTIIDALLWVRGRRSTTIGQVFLRIENICRALKVIAEHNREIQIIYPVHLNPNVQEPVHRILGEVANIHLIEPLSYPLFVFLMGHAYLILTDSGGIQEEASSLGKPVLVMRGVTERPEALETGGARLVGTEPERIISETQRLLDDKAKYGGMAAAPNPFGDGKAAKRIVDFLAERRWHESRNSCLRCV